MAKCDCGKEATHRYGRHKVCVGCYKVHARLDDRPASGAPAKPIPKTYDWHAEMEPRRIRES